MTSGIIVILAALVPFVVSVIAAKMKKDAEPETIREKTNEQIDQDIAKHDATDVTLLANSMLDKLQNSVGGSAK